MAGQEPSGRVHLAGARVVANCRNVGGVCRCRVDGVALDGGGGVAEGFGDDRDGCELRKLVQGAESCRPGAEDALESVP